MYRYSTDSTEYKRTCYNSVQLKWFHYYFYEWMGFHPPLDSWFGIVLSAACHSVERLLHAIHPASPDYSTPSPISQNPPAPAISSSSASRPAIYCNDSRTTRIGRRGSENNNVNRTQYCTARVGDLATNKDCKNSALKTHAKQHTMYFRFWSRKCDITPASQLYVIIIIVVLVGGHVCTQSIIITLIKYPA